MTRCRKGSSNHKTLMWPPILIHLTPFAAVIARGEDRRAGRKGAGFQPCPLCHRQPAPSAGSRHKGREQHLTPALLVGDAAAEGPAWLDGGAVAVAARPPLCCTGQMERGAFDGAQCGVTCSADAQPWKQTTEKNEPYSGRRRRGTCTEGPSCAVAKRQQRLIGSAFRGGGGGGVTAQPGTRHDTAAGVL